MKDFNEIKAAIKANFESNDYSVAMDLNKELLEEYTELKGKRSADALVRYYRSKAQKTETPATEEAPVPTDEPQQEAVEEPTDDATEQTENQEPAEEPKQAEFKFSLYKEVDHDTLKAAIEANCPEMKQFCVIKEYWEQKSDTEVIRSTEMFVDRDPVTLKCKGFDTWDEASAKAKSVGLVSYRKKGDFSMSEEGFPVGEVYCKVTVMYIDKALIKFLDRANGIKEIKSIEIA